MRRFLKIFGIICVSVIGLIIALFMFLQSPWGQRILKNYAVEFLEKKLGTPVHIDRVGFTIPKNVVLEGVLFIDRNNDTLLSLDKLEANIAMLELLNNTLKVNSLDVEGLYALMHRPAHDTVYNYQFIIDAFSDTTDVAQIETEVGDIEEGKAQSMLFDVARVRLKDITFIMDDVAGGTYFDVKLDSLLLKPKEINPGQMKYLVDELIIYKAQSTLKTFPGVIPPSEDTSSEFTPLILSADKLVLIESSYSMLTEPDSFYLYAGIGNFNASLELFDLEKSLIEVKDILLENAENNIIFGHSTGPIEAVKEDEDNDDSDTSKWRIRAQQLVLNQTHFTLDDNTQPRLRQGMDYSHMDFSGLSIILKDLNFLTDSIYGDLQHLATREKCGLNIIELKTNFMYTPQGASLNNLYLQTPQSIIKDKIAVSYPSLSTLTEQLHMLYLDMHWRSSQVGINDILLFTPPSLLSMLTPYSGQLLHIDGDIKGYLSQLNINDLKIDGLNNTSILLNGSLAGLPDVDRMTYKFDKVNIKTSKKDILPFMPASLTESLDLPNDMYILGSIQGSLMAYQPDLTIQTSDGDVALKGMINMTHPPEKYNLAIATKNLNVGKILKNDTMIGRVSLNGTLTGTSFDVNKMNAHLVAQVDHLDFNGYAYNNVQLDGKINHQMIDLVMHSKDFNADMDLVAQIDISGEYPSVESSIALRRVDLNKLGFFDDQLELGGNIDLNFSKLDVDYPEGYINWNNPHVVYNGEELKMDSVYVYSQPSIDSGQNIIAYIPGLLDARLTGRIPLSQLGTVTLQRINKYFVFNPNLEAYNDNYNVDMAVELTHHPLVSKFVPDLDTFRPLTLNLFMNPNDFDFNMQSEQITYGNHRINDLKFTVVDTLQSLVYNLTLDEYRQGDSGIFVNKPTLTGSLKNNVLDSDFRTYDLSDVENYAVGFKATYNNDKYIAALKSRLMLNYEPWNVNTNNWIAYHVDSGIIVNELGIARNNESIFINSTQKTQYNSPFDIKINNFELANISRMLNPETLLAEGSLNANINADISDSFPKVVGNLNVDKLKFYESEVGQLQANISNDNLDIFDIKASITQLDNNIYVNGSYFMTPQNGNDFDIDLDIASLNLKQFEGLSFGHLSDSKGFIKGALKLNGTVDKPKVNGFIQTDQLATRINLINSYWSFPQERIDFNNQTITFNDFKIYDSLGQHATISGNATTQDFIDYDLNLNFKSNRWMATNSTNQHMEWMYGKLILTSNIDIQGTTTAPILNGTVVVHDSTNFTYANIDDGPGIADHEGYVVFVKDVNNIESVLNDTTSKNRSSAMSMNLNIETEKEATFNVLVNALSGDILTVNGAAFINASMIPGGKFLMTGSYQIEDGFYELNYNFIKRKFKIQEGSVIQLTGDPLQADVNITAAYTADASAYDLMEKNVSQEELVFYKQRMPFDVILKISGKPLSPIISYDIVLSEDNAKNVDKNVADNIQRQLAVLRNDVSEMSKQVFGMLILGRFIADDPIKSGNPVSMEYYARQTASRFLSQQLNNLADKYVSGLDLSLDVASQEDYSTGQRMNRTDVNLKASKSLFNDRLTVTIGNDFQVEGRQLPGQENNLIPGNISLDYKLTKDGKYNVRGYRKNELLNVIDGYVVETGVGFMLKYEYNRFRELFYSKEKLREIYRKRREQELKKVQSTDSNTTQ